MFLVAAKPNLKRGRRISVRGKNCANCHTSISLVVRDKCVNCGHCVVCGRQAGVIVDTHCRYDDCGGNR